MLSRYRFFVTHGAGLLGFSSAPVTLIGGVCMRMVLPGKDLRRYPLVARVAVGSGQAGAALDFSPPLLRGDRGDPSLDVLFTAECLQGWAIGSIEEVLYCPEDPQLGVSAVCLAGDMFH
jgi:hypothetical protein